MKTIEVKSSDHKVWNFNDVILQTVEAIFSNEDIEYNILREGCDVEQLGFLELVFKICDKTAYSRDRISIINLSNSAQTTVYGLNVKYFSPIRHVELVREDIARQCLESVDKLLTHKFGLFIGRSNSERLLLASYLYKNHKDSTLLTFHYDRKNDFHRENIGVEEILQRYPDTDIKDVCSILDDSPLRIDEEEVTYPLYQHKHPGLTAHYHKFLIEIVCESYYSGNTFFPTEKTWRPILMKTPFIIPGPRNYIKNLKKLGFQTFDRWWDEGYTEDPTAHQIVEVKEVISRLDKLSLAELSDMYNEMKPVLEHNYQRLYELTDKDFKELYEQQRR